MSPMLSIVVVAKAPMAGKSKTRLIPDFGEDGSALLARAMLLDVLTTLSECNDLAAVDKILLYAPSTEAARNLMHSLLNEHDEIQSEQWTLHPVTEASNVHSSHLTAILQHALRFAQQRQQLLQSISSTNILDNNVLTDSNNIKAFDGSRVVFMGMDCPEVPLQELVALAPAGTTIKHAESVENETTILERSSLLCPAADGGYGLLAVPSDAPSTIFDGVQWSHSLTAVSQIKALTDCGIPVVLGPLMHDVDTCEDVVALQERLLLQQEQANNIRNDNKKYDLENCLTRPSAWASSTLRVEDHSKSSPSCNNTREALKSFGKNLTGSK